MMRTKRMSIGIKEMRAGRISQVRTLFIISNKLGESYLALSIINYVALRCGKHKALGSIELGSNSRPTYQLAAHT
jgi:hypothetical protein